ncbi:hypothetical protein I6A60_19745 [Frankia sp. AgB1.9]|nr:hypothetical protein [Frankia sp. AgW1.1]MBL7550096.1 hypothetical protein [Frankia sp. AgB1.9]MBL7621160.1 hypothetical protein [Frankia sp. AgB1.8]
MCAMPVSLDAAVEASRTGDLWLFRGRTAADRAIQTLTNSPVNHVGMALVLDDMPPMIWHAELGRSLPDRWTGGRHRGVQLHDLRAAVEQWGQRYDQRAWLRQLEPEVPREAEDAALRIVARLDGTPFPSTAQLAGRWLLGRAPIRRHEPGADDDEDADQHPDEAAAEPWFAVFPWQLGTDVAGSDDPTRPGLGPGWPDEAIPTGPVARAGRWPRLRVRSRRVRATAPPADDPPVTGLPDAEILGAAGNSSLETAYCAEVVAITYQAMGLLPAGRRPNWYDPGRFWSGDDLPLTPGFSLGAEIAVEIPD